MEEYNFLELREKWIEFFLKKGFEVKDEWGAFDDDYNDVPLSAKNAGGIAIHGFDSLLVVYADFCHCRKDTKTGGYIAVDFVDHFNKISWCPLYFDLIEKEETVWKAIQKLVEDYEKEEN